MSTRIRINSLQLRRKQKNKKITAEKFSAVILPRWEGKLPFIFYPQWPWLSLRESWHAGRRDSAPACAFRSATRRSLALSAEMRGPLSALLTPGHLPQGGRQGTPPSLHKRSLWLSALIRVYSIRTKKAAVILSERKRVEGSWHRFDCKC